MRGARTSPASCAAASHQRSPCGDRDRPVPNHVVHGREYPRKRSHISDTSRTPSLAHILLFVRALPTGTVTFLFTGIEGSTGHLRELGARYPAVLAEHRLTLRAAVAEHDGVEVDTQGDAFFVAFSSAMDAVAAAREAQRPLRSIPLPVRMAIPPADPTVTP